MILGFFEVPEDERPPESIWLDDEALSDHWEHVTAQRQNKYNGTESVPSAPLEQNELTAGFKR